MGTRSRLSEGFCRSRQSGGAVKLVDRLEFSRQTLQWIKIGVNMLEINGKQLEVDEEGYLANLNDWEKDVATVMAKEDGIDLSEGIGR